MFKLICILNCLLLVTTNPLQGLSCPSVTYQPHYVPEVTLTQPQLIQSSNFNPYQQQHTLQNQLSSYQTIPYSYYDQITDFYLDKILSNPSINALVNLNTPIYDQNGYEKKYYLSKSGDTPNVVNNYIIVPPEYLKFNQSIINELQSDKEIKNHKNLKGHNHKENVKCKREENIKDIKTYETNNKNELVDIKCDNYMTKNNIKDQDHQATNKKRKSSKNNDNVSNTLEAPKLKDYVEVKPKKKRKQRSKKTLDVDNKKSEEQKTNKKNNSKKPETANKKCKSNKKTKSTQKNVIDSQSNDEMYEKPPLKDKSNDITKKTADVDVCFDINEECACLENRRIRNNCYEPYYNYQQYFPKEISENIASYLNSIMSNQQFSTNYLNLFGNFPYNFNYLYQTPQHSIPSFQSNTNESSKKSKNRRKNERSNNGSSSKTKHITNKSRNQKVISNDCQKIVELEPQFIDVEERLEPLISQEITKNVEHKITKIKETESMKHGQDIVGITEILSGIEPAILCTDDDSKELLYVVPISSQEDFNPNISSNEINDEYYPDFTSDNIYLSKEEYEYNFHDRHYYNYDNEAEMSIEKRRYDVIDGKKPRNFNDVFNNEINKRRKGKNKNNLKNIENSSDVKFRTPPPLEFPDFKTEMINKDSFIANSEMLFQPDNSYVNYRDDVSKNIDINKNHKNEIETVYAHSKVVKYGATPNIEEKSSTFDLTETKSADKNLFSTDGKTTIVIAKSLGYPEDY